MVEGAERFLPGRVVWRFLVAIALICNGIGTAGAATLFEENFDGLAGLLQPAVDESIPPTTLGWTHTPPAGWSIDNANMAPTPGVTEWQGWSFTTMDFWLAAATQGRGNFTRGTNVFAVADPDEWDDKSPPPSDSGTFDSVLISPPITVAAGLVTYLYFDSHYLQEDTQTVEVRVSFNGGPDQVLLHYDGNPGSDNGGGDVQNTEIVLTIPAPPTASSLVIKWHMFNATNDWYWAIDNVRVTDEGPPPPPPPPTPFISLGPYLQFIEQGSATIFWQTDEARDSILEYGEIDPSENRLEDPTPKTAHEITITGLQPDTVYTYWLKATSGTSEIVSDTYEFNTTFNYTLPPLPSGLSPYPHGPMAALYAAAADRIIAETGITKGYCLVYGCGEGQLAYELAKRSELRIVGVTNNAAALATAAEKLTWAGIYGSRVTLHHVSWLTDLPFTKYFANLIVSEHMIAHGECIGSAAEMFRVLRPSGGIAYLGQPAGAPSELTESELEAWLDMASLTYTTTDDSNGVWSKVVRDPLPGAGEWSQEYANPTNSANSGDTLEGATSVNDLEVQWIGRPGADAMMDRNPRKPAPLSTNGRLFTQGLNRIIAQDAYNGAILWSLEIPDLQRTNMPRDAGNWCADDDYVYAAIKDKCWRLNAHTGELTSVYAVSDGANYDWGYVASAGNKLYGSSTKKGSAYTEFWGGASWYDQRSGYGTYKVCSDNIFAVPKDTGTTWTYSNGAIINSTITIGGGRVYFVESRHPTVLAQTTGQIGIPQLWNDQYLVALDADSGGLAWQQPIDTADGIVVFYLAYSSETLAIASSDSGSNTHNLYAYDARNGGWLWEQSFTWSKDNHGNHMEHPAIVGDVVYLDHRGFALNGGALVANAPPSRGKCGTVTGAANVLFYRDYSFQMWNPATGVESEWWSLRSGCWLSTITGAGMVLSPEGGGGCSCGLWFQTSLGFVAKE